MRSWLLCFFILLCFHVFSQKIDPEQLSLAEELKEKFEKADIALTQHSSEFAFYLDKSTKKLKVSQKDSKEYIALTYNVKHVDRNYYNDQISLGEYKIRNNKNRLIAPTKFCGHYTQQGIFHSDAQVCAYDFSIPQKGEIRSVTSTKTYLDPKYLTTVYFHNEVPIKKRAVSFKLPKWVNVEFKEINFAGFGIQKDISEVEGFNIYSFTINNLEAYPTYENQPGGSHFMPHIMVLVKNYTIDNKEFEVISSLDGLYEWYNSLTSTEIAQYEKIEATLAEIITPTMSDKEKIKAIFYWVQDNVKYIAYEEGLAGFKPEESHLVLSKRYGDCKGMANLTKDLLKLAGFDARLTWLGTNHLAYSYDLPSLAVDNHMICSVKLNDNFLYLDATEKYNEMGYLAERIQGKEVLIQNDDSYIVNKLPNENIENYKHETTIHYEMHNNELSAHSVEMIKGEFKKTLINVFVAIPKERHEQFFKSLAAGDANPDLVSFKKTPIFNRDSTLTFEYNVELTDKMNAFDNEIYIELDFKKDFYNEKIDLDRKAPVNLNNKSNNVVEAFFKLPEGYNVEYLPEALTIQSDHISMDLKYEVIDNSIKYFRQIMVKDTYIPIESFEDWNNAIAELSNFYDDQIILTKK